MPQPYDSIGPYTLIRRLGRGSFGTVWLAEKRGQIVTTEVALKIPFYDDLDLDVIRKEASLWLQASGHRNILGFIDADVYNNQPVIVSEYAPDGTLTDWLARHGGKAPSIDSGLRMIDGILAGLEHLHSKEIIHRDLKPDNILMKGDSPRLADFGIARILENTGAYSTRSFGSPSYMAPEAFRGKRSQQTDLWSTGVIFYQLLTGQFPFKGGDPVTVMHSVIIDELLPLPSDLPSDLMAIVVKSLDKDVHIRYGSATEMRRAVQRLLASELSLPYEDRSAKQDPTLRDNPLAEIDNEETLVMRRDQLSAKQVQFENSLPAESQALTKVELVMKFWEGFERLREETDPSLRLNNPIIPSSGGGKSYRISSLGNGFRLAAQLNSSKNYIDVNITVGSQHYSAFKVLQAQEREVGHLIPNLIWHANQNGESWVIVKRDFNLANLADWRDGYIWLFLNLRLFRKVFSPRIQELKLHSAQVLKKALSDGGLVTPAKEPIWEVMADAKSRQFWIVLWGDPEHSDEQDEQIFDAAYYDQGFPLKPSGVRVGDVFFVHRIHVSKIIYVAEVVDLPRESTTLEKEREPWRKKWKWSVKVKNLTPGFGSHWRSHGQKTFDMVRDYNETHVTDPAKISAMKWGRHVRIPRMFAEFMVKELLGSR